MAFDACLVALSLWLAHFVRVEVLPLFPYSERLPIIVDFSNYVWMWFVTAPTAPFFLKWNGFYRSLLGDKTAAVVRAMFFQMLFSSLVMILFKIDQSRLILLMMTTLSILLLIFRDFMTRRFLAYRSLLGEKKEKLLIATSPARCVQLIATIRTHPESVFTELLTFDLVGESLDSLSLVLHCESVNRVLISAGETPFEKVASAIRTCEIEGVDVCLLADFFHTSIARVQFDDFAGMSTLLIRSTPDMSWPLIGKEIMDRIGALVLLLLLWPIIAVIAVLVLITSPGSAIFRQDRGGINGRPFTMYKFRTMFSDAEMKNSELAAYNRMTGPVFKMDGDPRITPFGRFLRKHSLDELPQLWNVLKGEMSLVGPRPLPVEEVEKITDCSQRRRLSMKPGLTCLWQIRGRNYVSDFDEWVRLDLEYIDRWSLSLDIRILLQTLPAVLSGRGAS